ncbi:MAG: ABC transporter ATP-binding protein [Bacteroidales bacterium]|nr:ABC transporter ATP-binding protein [Bacteroidales bacterium]
MKVLQIDKVSKTFQGSCEAAVKEFSLDVSQGEIVALLGESGCGKTTLLRLISGFEVPDAGSIRIRDRIVADDRTFVPPEKRGVGVVFQDYALFPHKTVTENIRFGLFMLPAKEQLAITAEMIRLTGLSGLGKRYPHQLSGGQKQRVALARALAPKPRLILLDEPFSNLDSLKKAGMQEEIASIIRKTNSTGIFVTHDTKDVLAIADRVVVMKDGVALQTDIPAKLYKYPVNQYVARFFGKTNVLPAKVIAEGFLTSLGTIRSKGHTVQVGQTVLLSVRPDNFEVARSPENALTAKVVKTNFFGDHNEVICRVCGRDGKEMDVTIHVPPHEACNENTCFIGYKDHYPPSVLND